MKKRNNFRKRVSRFMVVIVVSSLLSSFYSSVAFAKDLSDLAEAGNYDDYEAESEESFGEDIVDENELSEESEDEAGEEASDEGISEEVSQEEISEEISEEELSEEELSEESSIEELSEDVSENEIASEESGNNEIIDRIESIEELFEIANSAYNNSTKSGWVQEDDNLRYYENGKAIKNCVRQIEGFYYAFDYEGNMLKDILTSIWDGGNDLTICAQEDGKLLTDSWYTTEYEETYYFGSDGIAYADGAYEIDGINYLFDYWGELKRNACFSSDQKYFISDSEGIAIEVTGDDGWKEAFGKKYYLSNGQFASGITEINGVMYGFYGEHYLCINDYLVYWKYDEDTDTYYYDRYVTNSDGQIVTNSWFEDEWGNRSYHGQDGRAYANGIFVVGKTTYLFNEWGQLWCNGNFTDGKKSYISDENGVATEVGRDGWITLNGNKYYMENGEPVKRCIRKIDGFYYAFTYEGIMLKDILTDLSDDDGNNFTVCAQEDGKLLTDSWYTTEYEETYYFGSNGASYSNGVYEIGGVKYLFGYWGALRLNSFYNGGQNYYISDSEGIVVEVTGDDGWKEAFGRKYYLENGQFVSGIKEINGVMYGFRDDCQLCVNNAFDFWEYNEGSDTNYCFRYATNSEGQLITNSWFEDEWGNRSYHGQDGRAYANGVFVIGETTYLFNEWSQLWCNGSFTDGKKSYISDANGVAIEIGQDGWTTIDGNKYYIENGEPVKSCVKEIDGSLYGFDYYGHMENSAFSIWTENGTYFEYYAAEDGKLHVNWWYEEYGTRYCYYGADGKKYKNNIFTIDGIDYLFDKYGNIIRNGGMTIDGINYVTDKDGKAQSIEKDGWVQVDNRWFYAENGVLVTNCVKEIKGALYYFNNYGAMAENGFITTYDSDGNQKCYAARNNGQLYRNEWYSIWNNERYAYLGNDGLAYANGVYKIDGTDYLFDTYGRLLRRGTITSNGKNYASDDNGIAYELKNDGWNQIGENWFYTEAGEIVKNEKRKINGYYYYFNYDGKMLDDEYYVTYSYKYDPTTDSYIDVREGYYAKKGGKLYVNEWKNGEYFGSDGLAYFDGVFEIDGNLYIFGSYGALRLTLFSYNNKNYLTDESGIAHEISGDGWMQLGDDYVYIQNGQLARGITRIDGEDYYFSYKGFLVRNTIVEYNKIAYYADESGRYSQMPEGFNAIGNNIYFVENGGIVKKAIKEIDGVGYAFDEGGKLIKDKGFYFEGRKSSTWNSYDPYNPYESTTSGNTVNPYPSGNASYNAYDPYNPDGKYAVGYSTAVSKGYLPYTTSSNAYNPYYADKDGVVLRNKWRKEVIDGIECWSYFGDNCRKLAGLNKIGQNLYYMDILGIMQTGWQEIDNEWYFFESNGAAQYGLKKINEKWYYFNDNGVMQTGWQKLNGSWYYFASGGARQTGWQKINGTWYYFASGGEMQTGWQKINGTWYYFAPGGAMQTGWQKINGAWYYFAPGGAMQTGWVKSGTKWYYMKSGGTMQTGWVKLGSTWYYMDTDGSMVTGLKKIGNKTYKFSSGGACLNP